MNKERALQQINDIFHTMRGSFRATIPGSYMIAVGYAITMIPLPRGYYQPSWTHAIVDPGRPTLFLSSEQSFIGRLPYIAHYPSTTKMLLGVKRKVPTFESSYMEHVGLNSRITLAQHNADVQKKIAVVQKLSGPNSESLWTPLATGAATIGAVALGLHPSLAVALAAAIARSV